MAGKSTSRRDCKDDPPPPGPNPHINFNEERRTNNAHFAAHEPQAMLFHMNKGQPAEFYYMEHVLMEHRLGLPIDVDFTEACGFTERAIAIRLMNRQPRRTGRTLAGDKGYSAREFVAECCKMEVKPHVAQNINRDGGSAIDARTTLDAGYLSSQCIRKRIQECFG